MRGSSRIAVYVLPALVVLVSSGCSRTFFRNAADRDVEGVMTEKNKFPDWDVKSWNVYPDPRARFADPNNPDRPPYPPDDYAARVLSPNPQHPTKKTGTGRYDGDGYLKMLQEWNAKNRADDPANARAVPPDSVGSLILSHPDNIPPGQSNVGAAAGTSEPSPWTTATARSPSVPLVLAPTMPSVMESHEPATILPAGGTEPEGPLPPLPPVPPPAPAPTEILPAPSVSLGAANSVAETGTTIAAGQPSPLPKLTPGPGEPVKPSTFPGGRNDPGAGEFPSIEKLLLTGKQQENYLRALTTNERGFRIKVDQAVELGLVNAREMQDQREALYEAALPVTLQRFNFAAQGFFTDQLLRTSLGNQLSPSSLGTGFKSDQTLANSTSEGFSKLFPTGATLMLQAANQVVINLGSGRPDIAFSNLGLNVTQPFLRGGGFAVTLEPLTQAERTLLYAMRSYTRFRKIIYVSIVTGGGLTNNPYGLPGLSENLGRGIGENLTAPTIGFLPILQSGAIVINNKKNVETLERYLRQYQGWREGGQISDLQVGLVEVQMLNTRAIFLGSIGTVGAPGSVRGYLDAIDNFKLQLGIPETVPLDLDIGPLKPIHRQLTKYERIYADVREAEEQAHNFNPNDPVNTLRPRWRRLLTESNLAKGTIFAKTILGRWDSWAKLSDDDLILRLSDLRKQRQDLLDRKTDRQLKGIPDPEVELKKIAQLEAEIDLAYLERDVRKFEKQPWLKKELKSDVMREQAAAYRDSFNAFYQVVLEARNERLERAHAEWPKLPAIPVFGVDALTAPLDDAYSACIQGALSSRLDLMDARGQVVDAYRQIAVTANALQGVFNVEYNLNFTGSPEKPLKYSTNRAEHQLVINAELPLVRRAQRNVYRTSLIQYQSARRLLMAFEDNIANDVRNDIRQLRALAEVYKIQQRVVEQSYSILENAAEVLFAPPVPGTVLDATTAAALTTQLLQAVSGLLTAQNTLYTYWVGFIINRIQLYLDLELMQLDERGIWRDESFPALEEPDAQPRLEQQPERLPAPREQQPGERLPAPIPVPAGPAAVPAGAVFDRK